MRVEISSSAGDSGRENEDWAGAGGSVFVVVDGAGSPPALGTGCAHGVAWYARMLGGAVVESAQNIQVDLVGALASSIAQVAQLHEGECDLQHPGTPSAAIAIARRVGSRMEYAVLADCSVLIGDGEQCEVITDRREASVGERFRLPGMWSDIGNAAHQNEIADYMESMRAVRNRAGGFWVAAADPTAAAEAVCGVRELPADAVVALMSDGASRPIDLFQTATADEFIRTLRSVGPEVVIQDIRRTERTDPRGSRWPRAKRHDDATVLVSR